CASAANSNTSPSGSSMASTRLVLLVRLSSCSANSVEPPSQSLSISRQLSVVSAGVQYCCWKNSISRAYENGISYCRSKGRPRSLLSNAVPAPAMNNWNPSTARPYVSLSRVEGLILRNNLWGGGGRSRENLAPVPLGSTGASLGRQNRRFDDISLTLARASSVEAPFAAPKNSSSPPSSTASAAGSSPASCRRLS